MKPTKPYTTDGCSGGMSWAWRKVTGRDVPWLRACQEHDRTYWQGGSKPDRWRADLRLLVEMISYGHPWLGVLMYAVVRIGGHPLLPLPWRWGYGYAWPRSYR